MGKNKKSNTDDTALQMARWSGSAYSAAQFSLASPPPELPNKKILGFGSSGQPKPIMVDDPLPNIEHDDLKQGSLYIIKIRNVCVALFEGWDDDMCCFSVLRSEATPMRWSEARYIPGDFDAYDAFDDAGNPPVHLWSRQLRVQVPINWFSIFEEARRKQRLWVEEQNQEEFYYAADERNATHQHEPVTPPATDKSSGGKSPNGSQKNDDADDDDDSDKDSQQADDDDVKQDDKDNVDKEPNIDGADSGVNNESAVSPTSKTNENASKKQNTEQTNKRHVKEQDFDTPSVSRSNTTPHLSKQLQQPPKPKYQAAPSSANNGVATNNNNDFSFPHNGDQFAIQNNGYQVTPPAVPPMPTDAGNSEPASLKPKRRSVHGFFRNKS
ncbi:hypothetical protein LRAMOSA01809 [Lichtheimia ramosa]|uniref:Uncharacterized protein n=1 Tax=Lichtheimia ramosa TaxID=688394 RepID=A0A077WKE2_9FUNG|nr:hypothetical protein LRAMOSA01809 [Lichtheimia ramosa]